MDGDYTAFRRCRVARAATDCLIDLCSWRCRRRVEDQAMRAGSQPADGHRLGAGRGPLCALLLSPLSRGQSVPVRCSWGRPVVGKAYSATGSVRCKNEKQYLYHPHSDFGANLASALSGLLWTLSPDLFGGGTAGFPEGAAAAVGQRLSAWPHWHDGCRSEQDWDAGSDRSWAQSPLRGVIGRRRQVVPNEVGALPPLSWRTHECRRVLLVVELQRAVRRVGA
ncbi:MAG: hypothetical protein AW08_01794 [Candidatus Accumulibacter adjunctus]|uniref:Uncharacterized protein n=1 Tax=Candidatus Accumulibacter adjunctus TaxID=1454001 RepID=A0A011MDK8_9PROT|nr:MAG: hypothetical protein AW08_01794 [Candidatus Accumulibacter adjunctus]